MEPKNPSSTEHGSGEAKIVSDKRIIPSEELLQGAREVWIRHADATYRLCVTRNGKLILQK